MHIPSDLSHSNKCDSDVLMYIYMFVVRFLDVVVATEERKEGRGRRLAIVCYWKNYFSFAVYISYRSVIRDLLRTACNRFSRRIHSRYERHERRSCVSRTVETQPGDYTLHGGILSKRVTSIGSPRRP